MNNDFNITAPADENPKLENIKKLNDGPNPCVLYSLIQLGSHYSEFKGVKSDNPTKMIMLTYEFPLLKQKFRKNDKEDRPIVLSLDEKQFFTERSNLTKIVGGMLGKPLGDKEFKEGVDITQFLGKAFIVDILSGVSKAGNNYQIMVKTSIKPANENNRKIYGFDWENVKQHNDTILFSMSDPQKALTSKTFAFLPNWIKQKIKDSEEGITFIEGGGVFSERKDFEDETPLDCLPKKTVPVDNAMPDLDDLPDDLSF